MSQSYLQVISKPDVLQQLSLAEREGVDYRWDHRNGGITRYLPGIYQVFTMYLPGIYHLFTRYFGVYQGRRVLAHTRIMHKDGGSVYFTFMIWQHAYLDGGTIG